MPKGKRLGYIINIKTEHTRYLKTFLERSIKNWPGSICLVIEGVVEDVKMLAIRYKYCKKKTMCFLFTEGATHTEKDKPYRARWKDKNRNSMYRQVKRLECCSTYFLFLK